MDEPHLAPQIKLLYHVFEQAHNRTLTAQELTGAQGYVLRFLFLQGETPTYARDLEQRMNLTHPTVSGLLHRLESKGFIALLPEQNDKRCRRIVLTEKARSTLQSIDCCFDRAEAEVLQPLTAQESEQLRYLLNKITKPLLRRCPPQFTESEKEDKL